MHFRRMYPVLSLRVALEDKSVKSAALTVTWSG